MTTALTAVQTRLEARSGRGFQPRKTTRKESAAQNTQKVEASA